MVIKGAACIAREQKDCTVHMKTTKANTQPGAPERHGGIWFEYVQLSSQWKMNFTNEIQFIYEKFCLVSVCSSYHI